MKTEKSKTTEAQLLALLKKVLPKATGNPELAGKIYDAVALELQTKAHASAFDKFCARAELPDLEPKSIEALQQHLMQSFEGADVVLKPNRKEKALAVEVSLPDGTQFSGEIRVQSDASGNEEESEIPSKFVPFPVAMPGDKELIWLLAKRETMSPDEAGIALTKVEEDFWGSKAGQKFLRDRVERIFPEFIARVPAGMLSEAGLKRHYKTPEPLKLLRKGHR
jgi:hypothetical protein